MLDFINIENARDGVMKLVELVDMFKNDEIHLEASRDMFYYPISPEDRFLDALLDALRSQLKTYAHFLGGVYREDHVTWIIEDGRRGYEKFMLDIYSKRSA